MTLYEVLTIVYANEIIALSDLPDYVYTSWPFTKVQ